MDRNGIEFVIDALPQGRTIWYDLPDRFALLALRHAVGETGRSIAELKRSQFGPLLNRPAIREICASRGSGWLHAEDLQPSWPSTSGTVPGFRLTLGTWPDLGRKPNRRWDQISRTGWNLVLQLNFPISHNRELRSRLPEDWDWSIRYPCHPIAGSGEVTLAWARIDLDLEAGEALIEEIQSDWVRDAKWSASYDNDDTSRAWGTYVEEQMRPLAKRWENTILSAALWFLIDEIGIRRLFFHTHETGARVKRIDGTPPPRSLYTELPRRFCFRLTHNGPGFVKRSADRQLRRLFIEPETRWHVIDLDRLWL